MRKTIPKPNAFVLLPCVLVLLVLFTLVPLQTVAATIEHPTQYEQDVIGAGEGPRLWYYEEEFRRDPALRATPEQVVILHLEARPSDGQFFFHTIPYVFAETATYSFCLAKDEPSIQALKLIREGTGTTVVQVSRSKKCKTKTIPAGFYRLEVRQRGKHIGPEGKPAFIHVPRVKRNLQAEGQSGSFACEALSAIVAPNGAFVTYNGKATTTNTVDLLTGGWQICSPDSSSYTLALLGPKYWFASPLGLTNPSDTSVSLNSSPTTFKLIDLGNFQFNIFANITDNPEIRLGSDNILHWDASDFPTYPDAPVFTIPLKYYPASAGIPPLQTGEIALFQGCNYDTTHGTWVINANLPNFGAIQFTDPSTGAVVRLDDVAQSVQVGPQTSGLLFANVNYGGQEQFISANIPCLSGTSLGVNTASSFKLESVQQFLAATNACQNCNLSGIDLSGLDLTGGLFSGTLFINANLTNTNFHSATLDNANLGGAGTMFAGTNLVSASLHCTNFSGADLSPATVLSNGDTPSLVTDFSCRVDLSGATLDLDTFPLTQWRYLNLTSATIDDVAGAILSTTSHPLDLSGAILSNTALPGVVLDGANLGCATIRQGLRELLFCTELSGTVLTSASLKQGNFYFADLQGALLDGANLEGADLSGAIFNNASLAEAILDGANLGCATNDSGEPFCTHFLDANLTSASLKHVTAVTPFMQGATLDGANLEAAELPGAILNNASLEGAILDGAILSCATSGSGTTSCAQLLDATLTSASLQQVNLVSALLRGADLAFTNLEDANLCGAYLDGSPTSQVSATLQGAYLKNVNLAKATLTGANLTNANFYTTSGATTCQPTANCGPTPKCASAVEATLDNAVFTGAYLAGVDFSDSSPQSADFSDAILVGANFTNANLTQDTNTGKRTNFTQAALQGATFANAMTSGADFTSAYVDLTSSHGATLLFQLDSTTHIAFPGYQPAANKILGCVQFTYPRVTVLPGTDGSNICPDGTPGQCSTTQWQSPKTPPPALPDDCTLNTDDINWILDLD